jgi:TPP-dependent indolepyruvate ferredoxin oxidoreductase alpha subunit
MGKNIYKPVFKNNYEVTPRKPNLCPGCPHRDIFFAIKKVFRPKNQSIHQILDVILLELTRRQLIRFYVWG